MQERGGEAEGRIFREHDWRPEAAGAVAMKRGIGAADGEPPAAPAPAAEPMPRKIIYNANLSLVVEDFDVTEGALKTLVKQYNGFIAQGEITGSTGSPRSGHWRVRVPADRLDAFLDDAVRLGVPQRNSRDSQDVTEEFHDLAEQIKNKKAQEARLRDLHQKADKVAEIMAIDDKLTAVRGEIERMEGRLRRLDNLAALSTVTVHVQEIKNYVPPQAPTFTASITSTFGGSVEMLTEFGKGLVLVAVALAPWLAVVAVLAVPVWLSLRRRRAARAVPGQQVVSG